MTIQLGNDAVTGIYLGSTPVTAVYLGSEQTWPDTTELVARTSGSSVNRAAWMSQPTASFGSGMRAVTDTRRNIVAYDSNGVELSYFGIEVWSAASTSGVIYFPNTFTDADIPGVIVVEVPSGPHALIIQGGGGTSQVALQDGTVLSLLFRSMEILNLNAGESPQLNANVDYSFIHAVGGSLTFEPDPTIPVPRSVTSSQTSVNQAAFMSQPTTSFGTGERAVVNPRKNIALFDSNGVELDYFGIEIANSTNGNGNVYYPVGMRSSIPNTIRLVMNNTSYTITVFTDQGASQVILEDGTTMTVNFARSSISPAMPLPANAEATFITSSGGTTTLFPLHDDVDPPTNFNQFATWMQFQTEVKAFTQFMTYDYDFPFTSTFTDVFFANNMRGTLVSRYNASDYGVVFMRLRGQLTTAGTTPPSGNTYLFRINRDVTLSGTNEVQDFHGAPGSTNYSDERVFHLLDHSRQRQLVLGDVASEFSAVRETSIDLVLNNDDMVDHGGVTINQFFTSLDNEENMFLVIAHKDWRPWT